MGVSAPQQRGQPGSFSPRTHCLQDTSQNLQHNSTVHPAGSNPFGNPLSYTNPNAKKPRGRQIRAAQASI